MADWTCCIPLPRSSALVEITSEGSRLFTKSDMYIVDIDQLYFMKLFSRLRKYYFLISSKNFSWTWSKVENVDIMLRLLIAQ